MHAIRLKSIIATARSQFAEVDYALIPATMPHERTPEFREYLLIDLSPGAAPERRSVVRMCCAQQSELVSTNTLTERCVRQGCQNDYSNRVATIVRLSPLIEVGC